MNKYFLLVIFPLQISGMEGHSQMNFPELNAYLEARRNGPLAGDPKGDRVPDGFMQRIYSEDAAAEMRRLIASGQEKWDPQREYQKHFSETPYPDNDFNFDSSSDKKVGGDTPAKQWNHEVLVDELKSKASSNAVSSQMNKSVVASVSNLKLSAEIATLIAIAYAATEMCFAFKNISAEEWKNAQGYSQKAALLASKTGAAIASRPRQAVALGKDVLNKIRNYQ